MLYLATMRWEGEDKLWWVPFKRGLFGVKFFYSEMGDVMMVSVFLERVLVD